jgi:hypothetical protein
MTLSILQSLAVVMIALSAANERLVEIVKSLFSTWFIAPPPTIPPALTDARREMRRERRVQLLAIFCAWIVASFVLYSQASWKGPWYECLWAPFPISSGADAFTIPTYVLALLTSGGAAFWNSILDFTKAAKQIKEQRLFAMRLNNDARMMALHPQVPPHP